MSRPRVSRTVAGTPAASSCALKAAIASRDELLATIAEISAQQVTLLESILRKLERIERSQYA
jgi:hypothetical protein